MDTRKSITARMQMNPPTKTMNLMLIPFTARIDPTGLSSLAGSAATGERRQPH